MKAEPVSDSCPINIESDLSFCPLSPPQESKVKGRDLGRKYMLYSCCRELSLGVRIPYVDSSENVMEE